LEILPVSPIAPVRFDASIVKPEGVKRENSVNSAPEHEIMPEGEINLYKYWKVLVKRKKIFIGIILIPIVIATMISLSLPRSYRGDSEISIPASSASNIPCVVTAPNIVKLVGTIDDRQKMLIFKNNSGSINRASLSLSPKSADKINITVEAKTADAIPHAFNEILEYVNNLPEIKEENARIEAENKLRLQSLIEAKKANLLYLNQIKNMIKKGQLSVVYFSPAELIEKDADLFLQIKNLQTGKAAVGILYPPSITLQPSNSQIKKIILITSLLSLFAGLFVIVLLEYIDRMKASGK
jgi:hypothetical protein